MMKAAIIAVASIVAILLLIFGIAAAAGSRLPREHQVIRSIVIDAPPAEVFRVITSFGSAPQWRTGLQRVEILEPVNGKLRFREHADHGVVTYEVVDLVPPHRLVTRIEEKDLGYGGSWTYVLTPTGKGTQLTITENGLVDNVLFRFMSRYVFGQASTIESYLSSIAARFGRKTGA